MCLHPRRPDSRRTHPLSTAVIALGLSMLGLWLAPADRARGDEQPAQNASPPRPCTAPEYRQFDFWLGTWEVVNRLQKAPAAPSTNRITAAEGGCVIVERYTGARAGYSGRSLSFYDARRDLWHQTWIDNRGQALYLEGRLEQRNGDRALVLSGTKPDGTLDRVTWRLLQDGQVQQLWEVSKDGGESWQAVFDGLYTPKEE